jgi:hypothetical protein
MLEKIHCVKANWSRVAEACIPDSQNCRLFGVEDGAEEEDAEGGVDEVVNG